MEQTDDYDYSITKHHLKPFINPMNDESFISEMEDTYGTLWEFKEHINTWSFGVNRWKNYVYLRYRVEGKNNYMPWNIREKVTLIEEHQKNYVVIVLREVDGSGKNKDHCHSIVINVNSYHGKFDLENLMTFLEGSQMESLNEEFEKSGYVPWKNSTAKSNATRLRLIFQTLDRYALENVEQEPALRRNVGEGRRQSDPRPPQTSAAAGSGGRGTKSGQTSSEPKKRAAASSVGIESTRKRKKSLPGGATGAGSSGSALTTVSTGPVTSAAPQAEYEKFAIIQKNFWVEHKDCFLLGMETVTVDIKQCIIASDQYVIRTLQRDIVEAVKNELIQLIDIKQRQKVCLTPVDTKNNLLQKKPEKWEDIRKGRFMIINGQHSITASKELQKAGCGEARRVELQTWDAFIVWSVDQNKLRNISKFYNCTNHLDHAQPTWGNQIISCRNIWLACKRPTDTRTEHATRKNNAVFDLNNYKSFTDAVVERFQNINPEKDGASIGGTTDLKNEIQIITLPDDLWAYWDSFLTKHSAGELIDPVSLKQFKEIKGFKIKTMSLKREFFKHCGHFTDRDFGAFAQHLLGKTPRRKAVYPKVSFSKTKVLVADNLSHGDWVERRKRKKIVLQDLMDIKPSLKLINSGGDVVDKTWKSWKARHKFTSASWDFLISHPKAEYFKRRLRNDAWLKRAKDLKKLFPEVLHMFTRFMKLKYQLPEPSGGVQVRGMDVIAKALVTSSNYQYQSREVNLAVLDLREVPRAQATEFTSAIDPFLNFLVKKLSPKMTEPNVWLFILEGKDDIKAATSFAALELEQYDSVLSTYVPSRAEMLNNVTNRGTAPDVPLLFLFKKDNDFADAARDCVKLKYDTPYDCVYYMEQAKNTEAKWRIEASELRMEFYLEILHAFATPEENVLGIYSGAKFMLAAKMFGAFFYGFVDKEDAKSYLNISYLANKMDKNDFMISNSPYSLTYDKPPSRESVVVHSNSPPSPPMTLDSPVGAAVPVNRERESVGAHVSTDPGVEGIDQFGTNTFQIHTWMSTPAVPADPPVLQTADVEEDVETDTEFERERQEQSEQALREAQRGELEDTLMTEVFGSDDIPLPEEAEPSQGRREAQPSQEKKRPTSQVSDIIIILSDDEDIDHPHSSDSDEDEDGIPSVKEMKPVIAPSGVVVKVEKDWWQKDADKRARRIARKEEREAKEKQLADALAGNAETNAKMLKLEEDSKAQYSSLQSQVAQLLQVVQSQATQSQSMPIVLPHAPPPQPRLSATDAPVMQGMLHLVSGQPYPRVDDKDDAVSLDHEDLVASTPTSQLPRMQSPDEGAFEVVLPEALDVSLTNDSVQDSGHYHRVVDNAEVGTGPATEAASADAQTCETSVQAFLELQSPLSVEEERVDYEVSEEDIRDQVAEEVEGGPPDSAAVEGDDPQAGESAQGGGVHCVELTKRQRLSRSLLSGSEKSLSSGSESEGGSCGPAPQSKPYMLRSAADAASAAIDYSKGNIEDGVVDSPPSRGPVRTPVCSPSPLKRASSSRRCSFSPAPRTDAATSRKLDLPVDGALGHRRLEDGVPSPSALPTVHIAGAKSAAALEDETRSALFRQAAVVGLPRLEDKRPRPSQSAIARRSPSADTLFRQRIFKEHRRSLDSKPTGTRLSYIDNVNASLPRPPPRGSRSLSTSEAPQSTRKPKRKDNGSQSLSLCGAQDGGSGMYYPSRREDIFRGLAKLKAMEAAKSNCTDKNNCTANSDA